MRHLYARGKEHGGAAAVQEAKAFERRRCGHRPEDYPEPLPELECLVQCVTGKAARKADEEEAEGGKRPGKGRKGRGSEDKNKHCYVVASQDEEVRRRMREVPGVPLIYIVRALPWRQPGRDWAKRLTEQQARSVMIMEPVSDVSTAVLAKTERGKFTNEITKLTGKKRKRGADADAGSGGNDDDDDDDADEDGGAEKSDEQARAKAKRNYGRKGPNPLSIKKKKKKPAQEGGASAAKEARDPEAAPKKKRIRKSKTKTLEKEASVGEGESAAVEAATTS